MKFGLVEHKCGTVASAFDVNSYTNSSERVFFFFLSLLFNRFTVIEHIEIVQICFTYSFDNLVCNVS